MRVYTAGPMSNLPQFNYPAFIEAAAVLRKEGYEVVSPAELDDPETRALALRSKTGEWGTGVAHGETWGDFLARDVKLLSDGGIEAIFVLPGWERSRGARLETFIGRQMVGLPVIDFVTRKRVPMKRLIKAWAWGK